MIVLSERPAMVKSDIAVDLPFPRHSGDPGLTELRREILGPLNLHANR
ncbi:MAG TPA: hypothetical protein VH023_03065 [Rhodopila sp.]|nr:hypothetical protein [Rhodopila sp.]